MPILVKKHQGKTVSDISPTQTTTNFIIPANFPFDTAIFVALTYVDSDYSLALISQNRRMGVGTDVFGDWFQNLEYPKKISQNQLGDEFLSCPKSERHRVGPC